MVANIRCAEIAADQLAALQKDQAWLALGQEAATGVVPRFGERAASLISSNLAGALMGPCVVTSVTPRSMLRRQGLVMEDGC
jgi:hypothetical protein